MQFWFEFASTYSYPAALRVETLARQHGVPLEWKAFLLGPIFQARGWNDSPFNLFPVRGAICGGIWSVPAPIWNCPSIGPVNSHGIAYSPRGSPADSRRSRGYRISCVPRFWPILPRIGISPNRRCWSKV